MGILPVESMKSADAAPTPTRLGPKEAPEPSCPWHHAQSRKYNLLPDWACAESGMGGEGAICTGDGDGD
jgi:hypothetical protein